MLNIFIIIIIIINFVGKVKIMSCKFINQMFSTRWSSSRFEYNYVVVRVRVLVQFVLVPVHYFLNQYNIS